MCSWKKETIFKQEYWLWQKLIATHFLNVRIFADICIFFCLLSNAGPKHQNKGKLTTKHELKFMIISRTLSRGHIYIFCIIQQ